MILTGANIKFYVNNKLYKVTQTVTLRVEYNEEGIYGIDVPWPQEIASGKIVCRGRVEGLRVKQSGGLQADNLRPLFTDIAASPYVSIRIQDRATGEDIVFIPNAKVSVEDHTIRIKNSYKLNFDFIGQIPLFALDRS